MTFTLSKFSPPFVKNTDQAVVLIELLTTDTFKEWLQKQEKIVKNQILNGKFEAKPDQIHLITDEKGNPTTILVGIRNPIHYLDVAVTFKFIQHQLSDEFINKHHFEISNIGGAEQLTKACIGWGLGAYSFNQYKEDTKVIPNLVWPTNANQNEVLATINAICLARDLINTPANDLGTDELAEAATQVAKEHKAKINVIKDKELIKQNFPMIYAVGQGSPRRPQLVDIKWGNNKHPKVTLVGKGVVYDTGGLNLKPGQFMRDMKKDMGGSAQVLGLASMIMALNLPIQLRVILPIAENAVAGNSFRPGDILKSRKGITVEIDDTDAEGRLVVGDALTYACEDKPDLLIDFCTLTGAARVALGYDIPAFFSNNDSFIEDLRKESIEHDDPVWPLPLWQGYEKEIESNVADIINDGKGRAGAIHGGLFLQKFTNPAIDWIHVDCYAWEQHGKPGRTQGGADTGMRALFHFIKKRYNK